MFPMHFLTVLLNNLLLDRGKNMEKKFKVIIEKGKDGFYIGEALELKGCYTQGKTIKETMENMKEAIELYLETKKELHQEPVKRFIRIGEVAVNA